MTPIHDDLRVILDAVHILSPARYVLLGEVRDVPPAPPPDVPGGVDGPGATPLVASLESDLYARLYTRPVDPPAAPAADEPARRDLVAALSAANTGRGTWEPGWTVAGVDQDGRVAVAKGGLTFWAEPAEVRAPGGAPRPGVSCRVRVGKERRNQVPGFYIALGDADGDGDEADDRPGPLVRVYWHLTAGAAAPFIAAVTSVLNAGGVPFQVKVPSDPGGYRRADAGVLYLRRRDCERVGGALARVHGSVAWGLRPGVPMFTKRLADGLALAEDPGDDLSFGEHRCRLVACALWRSFVDGEAGRSARAGKLAAVFRESGLDPARPYLGPGSRDDYATLAWPDPPG
jgi:hypothetical protein